MDNLPASPPAKMRRTAAGASFTFTVSVSGAAVDDPPYQVTCYNSPATLNGIRIDAFATADNTVTVTGYNLSGATFSPGSQTYQVTGSKTT